MKQLVRHLLELDRLRNGKPTTQHAEKRLYQWVFEECQLRWRDITKREVWDAIQAVVGTDDKEGEK